MWLCPMIKEIWFYLLSFEAIIGGNMNVLDELSDSGEEGESNTVNRVTKPVIPAKLLDLKFLI